MSTVTCW